MFENEIVEILDKVTDNFFPKNGKWYSHCFKKPNDLVIANLPCHLRDVDWLVKVFSKNIPHISEEFIKKYILTSVYFDTKRKEYEQEIVSWQIDWMNNGGENWIVDSNLGGELYMFSPHCAEAFRKGILDTLLAIGMDRDAIEEGIEKNSYKWRKKYIELAFSNMYNPIFYQPNLPQPSQEHFEKWVKIQLYQYYQQHKDSIDKYGEILPEMKMSDLEVIELREWLENEHKKRLDQIEEWKENRKGNQKIKVNI